MQLYTFFKLSNLDRHSCTIYLNDEYLDLDYDQWDLNSYLEAEEKIKRHHVTKIEINELGNLQVTISSMYDNNINKNEKIYMRDLLYKFDSSIYIYADVQVLRNRKEIEHIEYKEKNKCFIII